MRNNTPDNASFRQRASSAWLPLGVPLAVTGIFVAVFMHWGTPMGWAVVCAIVSTVATGLLAYSAWLQFAEKSLISKALQPPRFRDGKPVAVWGNVHSRDEKPLLAPFSHREAVSYTCTVYHTVTQGNRPHEVPDFVAAARKPALIRTRHGDVPFLGCPDGRALDHTETWYSPEKHREIYERAIALLADRTPKSRDAVSAVADFNRKDGEQDVVSEDGTIRADYRLSHELRPDTLLDGEHGIREDCVRYGEEVCLLGVWSTRNGSIVGATSGMRFWPGDPHHALKSINRRLSKCLAFVVILAVVAASIFLATFHA